MNEYFLKGIPIEQQRIIFFGKQLQDTETLYSYKIQQGTILHLFPKK